MPKFTIQRGFDATGYFSAEIEADTIEEAAIIVAEDDPNNPILWKEDGFDSFDKMEVCRVIDAVNNINLRRGDGDAWEQDRVYNDLTNKLDDMDMRQRRIDIRAVQVNEPVSISLVDGLKEMVLNGRLTENDIPDDFQWLQIALEQAQ